MATPMPAPPPAPHLPRVNETTFIGVAWGGVVLSALFLVFRFYARKVAFGRLFWDDAFVLLAWILFFASTIIWQLVKDYLYENLYISAGVLYPPPGFMDHTTTYLRASAAVINFFYTSLWFVKFSFLLFFRRLGENVRHQRIIWWSITVIVFASWLALLGTLQYDCLTKDFAYIEGNCTQDWAIQFQRRTLLANMCIDVITDALIMVLPMVLLWKVKVSLRQKLALAGVFSLTVLIMVFAIVRVTLISGLTYGPDESWLYLWSSVEQTVSIIVACLASFRILFVRSESSTTHQGETAGKDESDNSKRGFFQAWGFKNWLSTRERATQIDTRDHDASVDQIYLSTSYGIQGQSYDTNRYSKFPNISGDRQVYAVTALSNRPAV